MQVGIASYSNSNNGLCLFGGCYFNHYLSKDIEDFLHLQMGQLGDMLQMYESQE